MINHEEDGRRTKLTTVWRRTREEGGWTEGRGKGGGGRQMTDQCRVLIIGGEIAPGRGALHLVTVTKHGKENEGKGGEGREGEGMHRHGAI